MNNFEWLINEPIYIGNATLYTGDARAVLAMLPAESVHCCVTSPPYFGLRDYGVVGQLGLENTPEEYIARMVEVFSEVRRVLRADGTLWLNIGDAYWNHSPCRKSSAGAFEKVYTGGLISKGERRRANGHPTLKMKDLIGIPWMLAFALRTDGWFLRSEIIWHKPNPMPESVTDRPTKAHEQVFLFTKSVNYHYDAEAIKEEAVGGTSHSSVGASSRLAAGKIAASGGVLSGGTEHSSLGNSADGFRNRRSVWTVASHPFKEAHFATFPLKLIEPCILAGSRQGDTVLDPFSGAGTTALGALQHSRRAIGIDLNPEYTAIAERRLLVFDEMFT
jgi:DNA modification methylase